MSITPPPDDPTPIRYDADRGRARTRAHLWQRDTAQHPWRRALLRQYDDGTTWWTALVNLEDLVEDCPVCAEEVFMCPTCRDRWGPVIG